MQIHVKTSHSPEGLIVSEIRDERDMGRKIAYQVMNTQDQQIRHALIEQGCTPPPTKQEGLAMKLVFEKWAADRNLNTDTYNGNYVSKATQEFCDCWQEAWNSK